MDYFRQSIVAAIYIFSAIQANNAIADCYDMEWSRSDRPWDYYSAESRLPDGNTPNGLINLVEKHHFNQDVRALRAGQTSRIPGDLLFILKIIPNHPQVLLKYSEYERKYKSSELIRNSNKHIKPPYTASCLIEKAIKVFPQHAETHKVLGLHHFYNRDYSAALGAFKHVEARRPDDRANLYFIGLTQCKLHNLEQADLYAKKAFSAGYQLKGLSSMVAKGCK